MADGQLDQVETVPAPTAAAGNSGLFSVVKAVAFVSVIVIVEIVAAAMLAPSAADTAQLGQDLSAAATDDKVEPIEHHSHDIIRRDEGHKVREVELGIYNITRYNPATNTTLAIDFELYGTVLASDITTFRHDFENNKARVREQVTMTLHSASSADLTDAGLGLIKRQILEKTNRALGQPLVREVLFSKFSFVER